MLRIFRNNSPFTVIVLGIMALAIKFQVLLRPAAPEPVAGHFLYNYIIRALFFIFRHNAYGYTLLAIAIIFLQSLYIKAIADRHKLFPRFNYIPSLIFIVLTTIYPLFSCFSETLIVNWFLLGAMDIMFSFTQTTQPRKLIYNAGFLLSVAAMFQFTMLAFFLLLLVGMVMFRTFNVGEWSVAVMGYFTPPYFLAGILFLTDKFRLFSDWKHIGYSLTFVNVSPLYIVIVLTGIGVLLFCGVYAMQQNVAMSNIYVRRDWTAVSFYLIISIFVGILTDPGVKTPWLIAMPALSIIISHAFLLEKNKVFSNFTLYFSIIYLVLCLWADKYR